jgi:hypothetical protein
MALDAAGTARLARVLERFRREARRGRPTEELVDLFLALLAEGNFAILETDIFIDPEVANMISTIEGLGFSVTPPTP